METLTFYDGDSMPTDFFVLEQLRLRGCDYLLVSDSDEDEADALILKDISDEAADEAEYVIVEDEDELDTLMKLFSELLDDTNIRM